MMIGLAGLGFDVLYAVLLVLTLLWIWGRYKCCRHGISPPTTGGGVSPSTESTMRLLIGHRSGVELITSCGAICIGFVSFCMWFIIFIHVCGSPGGRLLNGGMM